MHWFAGGIKRRVIAGLTLNPMMQATQAIIFAVRVQIGFLSVQLRTPLSAVLSAWHELRTPLP